MMEQTTNSPPAGQAAARPRTTEQEPQQQQPSVTQSADQALQSVSALYGAVDGMLQRQLRENPYTALAVAAGVGFVLGGGMRTPFGQLLVRLGVRAFGAPLATAVLHGVGERLQQG
jgi:ElaB/YqjD/DUF883 family membrane-anchored ribosome-binding protein